MFVKGQYYWVLSQDEYNFLSEAMQMYLDENPDDPAFYDFSSDFVRSDDGYYVAGAGDISEEEAGFLTTLGIGQYLDYKQSTESTNFFG